MGRTLITFSSIMLLLCIIFSVRGCYKYENEIGYSWSLADKSSTIEKKSEHIDNFVKALESSNLKGSYNAVLYTTPNNSFDQNLAALKTLQQRLHEIQTMDIKSFEYQTAIQQITQQEQGEASEMICVLSGCWWKANYFLLWDWVGFLTWTVLIVLLIIGILTFADE